jgi:tRNA(fMet)-specific endonuclease VapC
MSPSPFVLDTSVLVHAVRRDRVWQRIQAEYKLFLVAPTPLICVVSVGELRSLSLYREWGPAKREQMNFVLGSFAVADINHPDAISSYAAIDSHFQRQGRSLGKNDLWIAAITAALGGHLLTCDRDFEDLDTRFLSPTWIDPS